MFSNKRMKQLFFCSLAAMIFLAGCGHRKPNEVTQTPVEGTRISSPTFTPQDTATPAPTIRPTKVKTPTPTALPTLTIQQANTKPQDFLTGKNYCAPGCYYGITPGKTTYEEVIHYLSDIGFQGRRELDENGNLFGYSTLYSPKESLDYYLFVKVENEVVDTVYSRIYDLQIEGISQADWSAFTLKEILLTYGLPSRVGFFVSWPHEPPMDTSTVLYHMTLYYDGEPPLVIAYYYGKARVDENSIRICPQRGEKGEFDAFRFWLGTLPKDTVPVYETPLKSASSMTIEEFYTLFTKDGTPPCLNLKKNAFPY